MKKRGLSILLALVMLMSLLTACGGKDNGSTPSNDGGSAPSNSSNDPGASNTGSEEITLRWVGAGWNQNDKANKIIEKWSAIHPDIKIEYVELGDTADTSYMRNLDTMISGGEVVDLTYLTYNDVYKRVLNGGALPLDEYIAAAGDDYEDMYGTMTTTLLKYDGSIYGVPFAGNTFKVFYNKTMTDNAGITIPENWSIDEFTETVRKLNTSDVYGCVFPFTWSDIIYAPAQLSGWVSVVEQPDGSIVPNFDSDIFKKAMTWAKSLADEGLSPNVATIEAESLSRRQALATGQTAMTLDGPYTLVWLQNYMFNDPGEGQLDFELGVTNIPYLDDSGKDISYNTVAGAFYLPKSAAYPAQAYEFAKFICNECPEEAANYMPVYTGADMAAATTSFTEYLDNNGEMHTDVYPQDVAISSVATPFESYIGRWNFDPALASYTSVMATLFDEQYKLYFNGEMELDAWIDMMQQLGAAEIANVG